MLPLCWLSFFTISSQPTTNWTEWIVTNEYCSELSMLAEWCSLLTDYLFSSYFMAEMWLLRILTAFSCVIGLIIFHVITAASHSLPLLIENSGMNIDFDNDKHDPVTIVNYHHLASFTTSHIRKLYRIPISWAPSYISHD